MKLISDPPLKLSLKNPPKRKAGQVLLNESATCLMFHLSLRIGPHVRVAIAWKREKIRESTGDSVLERIKLIHILRTTLKDININQRGIPDIIYLLKGCHLFAISKPVPSPVTHRWQEALRVDTVRSLCIFNAAASRASVSLMPKLRFRVPACYTHSAGRNMSSNERICEWGTLQGRGRLNRVLWPGLVSMIRT